MPTLKKKILEVVKSKERISLVILYGSAASGRLGPQSDIDIAVCADETLSPDERLDLYNQLCRVCQREVDLIDLSAVSGPILHEICGEGEILLNRQPEIYGNLMIRLLDFQTDMMPNIRHIWETRREKFLS